MALVVWRRPGLGLLIGAGILLGAALAKTAVSSHAVAPAVETPATAAVLSSPDGPVPPAIHTTVRRGTLAVSLTVMPVDVGPVRFLATVDEGDRRVGDAQVSIRLAMPAQPIFGVVMLPATPCGGGYCAQGSLPALGRWRAEVLVRGRSERGAVRDIPFDLLNGANARFLFAQPPDTRFGPARATVARAVDGSSIVRVLLRPGLAVRALAGMPNMGSMGTAVYAGEPQDLGWYGISLAFPMTGVEQLQLQVRTTGGWHTARTLLYDVDSLGNAVLLTNAPS